TFDGIPAPDARQKPWPVECRNVHARDQRGSHQPRIAEIPEPALRRRHVVTTESTVPSPEIEALFAEERKFPPPAAFTAQANVGPEVYEEAERDFEAFWAKQARERISWIKPFEKTLE